MNRSHKVFRKVVSNLTKPGPEDGRVFLLTSVDIWKRAEKGKTNRIKPCIVFLWWRVQPSPYHMMGVLDDEGGGDLEQGGHRLGVIV